MADNSLGTARIDVTVDTEQMQIGVDRAKARLQEMSQGGQAAYDALDKKEKRRVDNLRRQVDTLGLTKDAQLAYDISLRSSGKVQDELLARLQANQRAIREGARGFNEYGQSAKQTQAALRGVPAQLTDIFVSLQGGQAPLTVLLQQGGQLKDMFGGIVPAARALGGALLALVNPFTVVSAIVVGLGLAWKSGYDEQIAYRQALIETGKVSAQTADSLADSAQRIGDATDATVASAAAAIVSATRAGFTTRQQIEAVATAATAASVATGRAIEDTVADFKKLGEDPVQAIAKLNEQQHFLTAEVYESIKSLQEQGRTVEAVTLAVDAYAKAVEDRSGEIVKNLGLIERGWHYVKVGARTALDDIKAIGRDDTAAEQLADLREKLQFQMGQFESMSDASPQKQLVRERIAKIKDEIAAVMTAQIAEQRAANNAAMRQSANDQAIAFDQELMRYRTNAEKAKSEKIAAAAKADKAIAEARFIGDIQLAERLEAQKAQVIAGIERKYADKSKKSRTEKADAGDAIVDRVQDQIRLNEEAVKSEEKLTASQRLAVRVRNDLADSGIKMNAGNRELLQTLLKELEATDKLAVAHANEIKLRETMARLNTQLNAERIQQQRQATADLVAMGNSSEDTDRIRRRLKIEQDYIDEVARLRDRGVAEESEEWKAQEEALREHRDRSLQIEEDYQRERAMMMEDFSVGYGRAVGELESASRNVAGVGEDIWSNFFTTLGDAAGDFATKGKASMDDFVDYTIKAAIRLLANKAIMQMISYFGGGPGAVQAESISQQNIPIQLNAKGGVYGGKSLKAFSGNVYNTPQVFAFAKGGVGVFGEAGDEAIMPLTRTSGGKLGVQAVGSGGGNGDTYVEVYNQTGEKMDASASTEQKPDGSKLIKLVLNAVADDINNGGMVGRTMKGRFGLKEAT